MSKEIQHPADIYAGKVLRRIRHLTKISQVDLANKLGITFQQIQKYEKGINRLSVSRLSEICSALDVEPSAFFECAPVGKSLADNEDYIIILNQAKTFKRIAGLVKKAEVK